MRAVDDPAYRLEDEVVAVPHGCHPGAFLVRRYGDGGLIPREVIYRHMGYQYYGNNIRIPAWTGFTIPSQVAENAVSEQRIADLYPLRRPPWCLPETVKCVRLKNVRNHAEF